MNEKRTLPSNVEWMSNDQVAQWLGCSTHLVAKDKAALAEIKLMSNDRVYGYSREQIALLAEFRRLVQERGRAAAMREIYKRKRSN